MIKLYNSLTNTKEDFVPIRPGQAGVYSCGPTVYDRAHIGNLRAFLAADVLVRTLRLVEGLDVKWVMNFTDIDDKMIDKMHQTSAATTKTEPQTALRQLADANIAHFKADLSAVGIDPAGIHFIRATDNIALMQKLIRRLVGEGMAYVSAGSVYFSIAAYRQAGHPYGLLVKLNYDAQARVTDDQDQKEGIADFALWKGKKEGEPYWEFELNGQNLPGRPGWHIECSAMSTKELGQPFDIHTGGVDLKFPHHENEIAQCGGELANYFVHSEHLRINAEKMSKSLGNFYTLAEVQNPLAFRYLCLQTHYRSQMDYSTAALNAAAERLNRLRTFADQLYYGSDILPDTDSSNATRQFNEKITDALANDLNSPAALAALSELEGKVYSAETLQAIEAADQILGLQLVERQPLPAAVHKLITEYDALRQQRQYDESDRVRAHVAQMGYGLNDTKYGTLVARNGQEPSPKTE